jgi:hypothetical protein
MATATVVLTSVQVVAHAKALKRQIPGAQSADLVEPSRFGAVVDDVKMLEAPEMVDTRVRAVWMGEGQRVRRRYIDLSE